MCFGDKPVSTIPASVAQPTPTSFPFKKGDKVRVGRKATSFDQGWRNAWSSGMDQAVGKIGIVTFVLPGDKDVSVQIPGIDRVYGYPSFVLEPVMEVPPVQTTTIVTEKIESELTVGTRVSVKYHPNWDGEGVIERISSPDNYVVKFDRAGFYNRGGFAPRYLTALPRLVQSNPALALPYKPSVTPTVAPVAGVSRQSQALHIARGLAVQFAKTGPVRRITIDVVQSELEKLGFKSTDLGNSAGVIFKGGQFENTGVTVKSTRPGNHNRRVTVWEYVGQ